MTPAMLLFAWVATRVPLPHGFAPAAVAAADFNGDGHADFAVCSERSGTMIVLLDDGRGHFRVMRPVQAGAHPSSIAATPRLIAIANHETDYVTLLTGDGTGAFVPRTLHLHSKPHPHAVAIGDFDGDGRPDLAVDSWAENRIMLLFGRDGWRGPGAPIAIGTKPYWTISAADVDGDGKTDLAVSNQGHGTVSILIGDGHGHFAHAHGSPFAAGPAPFAAAIGDINGDGRPDVVVANYSGHATYTPDDGLTWIRNDGNRRFTPLPHRVAKGDYSARIATGDLNGDGIADVAFSNGNRSAVTIVYGSRNGPAASEQVEVMRHPHAVAIAGGALIVASEEHDEVRVLRRP